MLDAEIKRIIFILRLTKIILVSYAAITIGVSFVIPVVSGFQYITSWGSILMLLIQNVSLLLLAWAGPSYAIVLLRLLWKLLSEKNGSQPRE